MHIHREGFNTFQCNDFAVVLGDFQKIKYPTAGLAANSSCFCQKYIWPLYSNGEILVIKKNLKSENLMSKGIQFKGSERIETSNEESSASFSNSRLKYLQFMPLAALRTFQ